MQIHISTTDGVPIYQQIVNQIKHLVAAGRLAVGDELPSIRVLADTLSINPSTVVRAYRILETAGIVEKQRSTGTYVSDRGSSLARRAPVTILSDRIDALIAEALHMHISLGDVISFIRQRHAALQTSGTKE